MTTKNRAGWYFLLAIIVIYLVAVLANPDLIISALKVFVGIITKVIPIIIFVFVLMLLTNYFIKPKSIVKHLGKKSGIKGWIIAIVAGIISTGPIYVWFPMLSELQKHGVRDALIAVFLYNRAIKIPLIPMLVLYFGMTYSIVLLMMMMIISVFQGMFTEKLVEAIK